MQSSELKKRGVRERPVKQNVPTNRLFTELLLEEETL
jgi:hypothetical protein